ncbi:TPA: hypothetical protein G8N10_000327 [Salmonella enterica]|uniref:Uncharacterized protein n=1 Tax=Salmonella enterica TaxID=28901 RepID=A0A750P431_SALER|nr:hypothetical protein [Salmonella enterica]
METSPRYYLSHGNGRIYRAPHQNGQRFRDAILSRGNSTDLETLYSAWRGHEPHIDPMLQYRGLDR